MAKTELNPIRVFVGVGALTLVLWPLFIGNAGSCCRILGMAFFYAALAFSWNIYALTGALSLGHAAFFGLGAYGSALADHYLHLSPILTMPLGAALAAVYGIIWSAAFKPLRGARFALATLASVEIPRVIIDNWDSFTLGSLGIVGIQSLPSFRFSGLVADFGEDVRAQYYLLFLFMLLIGMIHRAALTSRWGWAVRSIREDEIAASALGVNVQGVRSRTLILSTFLTGLCGGFYVHMLGLVEPALVFNIHISALPLVLSVFGGRYGSFGPLVGALILYPLDQLLFRSWLPVGHAALYGLVVIIVFLFFPQGIGSWLQHRLNSAWS